MLDASSKVADLLATDPYKVSTIHWADDATVLVDTHETVTLGLGFTARRVELGGVIVKPLGGKAWPVFYDTPLVSGGVFQSYGTVQRDGHRYGYFSTLVLEQLKGSHDPALPVGVQHPDLYEVDLDSHHARDIATRPAGEGISRSWLVDGKGAPAATLDLIRDSGHWQITNQAHTRIANGVAPDGSIRMLGFTGDGAGLVYALREGESDRWYQVPLAGGPPAPFLVAANVRRLILDRQQRIIGYVDDDPAAGYHYFDPHRNRVLDALRKTFAGSRILLVDGNDSFDRLVVKTGGPGDPGTWWSVDLAAHKADPLGTAYPMAPQQVAPYRMVPFTAADGTRMEGVLTLPPDRAAKALPVIVLPHGGPARYDAAEFDWLAQAFASRGYAVFQPNFRGSTGYGAALRDAGKGEWGRKMQTDLSDGLAELARQGLVDPRRACIAGQDYGGYAALAGVTLQQGIYRCAVSVAGLADLAGYVITRGMIAGSDRLLLRTLRAELGPGRDLAEVSPIHFADRVGVPVLLIHAKGDPVIDCRQSERMEQALRAAGKQVTLLTLPGEDHWLSDSASRLAMLQATMDFVLRHNPPDPAPAG